MCCGRRPSDPQFQDRSAFHGHPAARPSWAVAARLCAALVCIECLLDGLAGAGIEALPVSCQRDARIDYLFRGLDPQGADAWAGKALKDQLRAWRAGAQG